MSEPWTSILSVGVVVVGWVYNSRRNRRLSRKQHTFNSILNTGFNERYINALTGIKPYTHDGKLCPATAGMPEADQISIRFILNHFEFVAAGVRNGDIDEVLMKDVQRGTVVRLYETFEKHIYEVRSERGRDSIYEHIEWLYNRWKKSPPGWCQRKLERAIDRPIQGARRNNH